VIDPIGVVGLGMVGGTVSRAFAEVGVGVCGYDRYLGIGTPERLAECRVVFLCVPTPSLTDGGLDVGEVWSAMRDIEPVLKSDSIVAIKSTVPPGTIDRLSETFPRIEVAGLPEFLVATKPDETFTHPDRVIIGARSSQVATILGELIGKVAPEAPVIAVPPIEAELAKLCSNALLAAKVAMANQLSDICERYEVSWSRVKAVVALDRRIGPDHLSVTGERGFGGACLPKDLHGLIAAADSAGRTAPLLRAIADFNRRIRERAAQDGTAGPGSGRESVSTGPSASNDDVGPPLDGRSWGVATDNGVVGSSLRDRTARQTKAGP
jgi:nucleotide sugar dehydrogenase